MISSIPKRPVLTRGLKKLVLENPSALLSLDTLTRSQLESFKKKKVPSVVGSPLASSSSQTSLGLIAEWRKQLESTHWIQCDNEFCMKWRKVTQTEVKSVTDESKWFCFMNKDEKFRSCDVPEENTRWYDNTAKKLGLVYVKSAFTEGMLVLAKFPGYCKWPALITRDPCNNLFVTFTSPGEPYTYHVEFLGNTHSHGWVKASSVDKFGKAVLEHEQVKTENSSQLKRRPGLQKKPLICKHKEGKQTYRKNETVHYAIKEAEHLQLMSPTERLGKCKFLPKKGSLSNHETSICDSIRDKSKNENGFNLCSSRSKFAEISRVNKLKKNVEVGESDSAKSVQQMNCLPSQEQRNQTKRSKYLRSDASAEHYKADSPVIQHLNFSDVDGSNVQLNFSSNPLADHSKEEKFVLDVEMYKRNERAFDHDVYRFMKRNNVKICRPPTWHKTPVTLFQLFLAVHERGGYKKVCTNRCWTAVYREVADVSTGIGGLAKNYYRKYLYPYELYVKGKDYSKHLKLAQPKLKKKKSNVKEHQTASSDVIQHTAENVKPDNGSENCLFSELNDLESEKSLDLMELLGNLEQESNLCCLEEDVAVGQSKLGIDITFCDESPVPKQTSNIVETDTVSEFGTIVQPETEDQVPDTSIFSIDSTHEDKFLYEMQALQKELYEQIDFL